MEKSAFRTACVPFFFSVPIALLSPLDECCTIILRTYMLAQRRTEEKAKKPRRQKAKRKSEDWPRAFSATLLLLRSCLSALLG